MGGGKGSNTTKSTFKLPPEFIKAYNESLGLARQAIQQPYTPYTGQLVAGLTPGQQRGIANIEASQGMALPFIQEGAGLTREAARGITPELYERFYSPYVRDVAEATQANLLESAAQQRSGLKSGAIGAGAFGGDRAGIAQAEMARQQQLGLGKTMADIYNQGYGQAMGLAGQQVQNLGAMGGQLAGMGTTAQTSALQGAQAQLAAGAQEQATNQAQLQAAYDQFLQQQSYPFQIAQFFANIAQGLGSTAGGTSSTTAPGPNLASQLIGGATAAGNLLSGIGAVSDERAKENIEAVGTLNDGQTVYRYNFKGDPKTQIGLLAQEVEQRNPGAVTEVKGLKMVDYKGATNDAANSMGGVVGPSADRQGFMAGGIPYGGVAGVVPQTQMMTAGTSKIPQAATPSDGGEFSTPANAFGATKNPTGSGFEKLAGLFSGPSIYNAGGVVGRNAYAEGGVPFMPYSGGRGWVPEGKLGGGGSSIPSAPNAYEDKGLAEDWQDIKPLTDDQASNLRQLPGRIKGLFADPDMAAATYMTQPSIYETYDPAALTNDRFGEAKKIAGRPFTYALATGGVAGRGGYQFGGEPTMEEAMAEAEAMRGPQGVAGGDYTRLLQKESGNNFAARNKQGYVGRAQFGDARLEDARRAGVLPEGMDKESFRLNPNAQKAVEDWHFSDINSFIDNRGLGAFEGKTVGGIPVTREGLVNVAHLGGKGGLEKFITSGGRYNPVDANGTRLSDYLAMGSQSGGVGAATAPSGYSDTQIMPVSAEAAPKGVAAAEQDRTPFSFKNLFASEERPSIIEGILGRRLSPEARAAALNASFALMAGRSPNFMVNLGEAGRVGTQAYYNAVQQKQAREQQAAELAQQQYGAQTNRMIAETARDKAVREQQEQAARDQMLEEAIAQLPPDQQAAARIAPEEFIKAQVESMFGTDDLPALVEEYREAVKNGYTGTLEDWKKIESSSGADLGLQPVPLVDAENNFIGYGQMSKSGGIYYQGEPIDGVDVRPMNPADIVKTKEIGKGEGRAIGEARGDIAGAEKQANITIEKISELEENPVLDAALGWTSYLPDFAVNSQVIDVRAKVDELMGGAFLEARTILKGGGQITDFESARAERAYSRMERSLQASDPKVFRDALDDFREAVQDGVEKLRATARLEPKNASDEQETGPAYRYNPDTQELEEQ